MYNNENTIKIRELSCGIVTVRYAGGDWQLLVLRTIAVWDFPKSVITPNEDAQEAAQRITAEQTGITDLDFVFGEDYKETVPNADNKVSRYYVAETRTAEIILSLSPAGKPQDWRWVTCDEAEDLLPPRLAQVLEWIRGRINEG